MAVLATLSLFGLMVMQKLEDLGSINVLDVDALAQRT
jgi:hypothetical protein